MTAVDEVLRGLYAGVSRQADTLRLSGQVDDGINCLFSVLDGGFRKRGGSEFLGVLTGPAARTIQAYFYRRDTVESYCVVLTDGDLWVFDLAGAAQTVTFPNGKGYLAAGDSSRKFRLVTVGDTTFVVNQQVATALTNHNTGGTWKKKVQTFDDLPTSGVTAGDVYEVIGTGSNGFTGYFVQAGGDSPDEKWFESADVGIKDTFDATTMPHALVRTSLGNFTFDQKTWGQRTVGDINTVPNPDFVGKAISDITYYRGRLTLLAGENAWCSGSDDALNFWPSKTTQVVDTDAFGRTASTLQVNNLGVAVPLRKVLFCSSSLQQFEMSASDVLTPKTAVFDATTSYSLNVACRPALMGQSLFFVSEAGAAARLLEYVTSPFTYTLDAFDISEHVQGFLQAPCRALQADAKQSVLFLLKEVAGNELYVWRSHVENNERKQSAWTRWQISGEPIDAYVDETGYLYVVVWADGVVALERYYLGDESQRWPTFELALPDGSRFFQPRLDRLCAVTGVYDGTTDLTTWTLPYAHRGVASLLFGSLWAEQGTRLAASYGSTNLLTASGDFSTHPMIAGLPYTMRARLSPLYPRDQQGRAQADGTTNVATLQVAVRNSGYIRVEITAPKRATMTKEWTGRQIGDGSNQVSRPPIPVEGSLRMTVAGPPNTIIELVNDTHYPSIVTEIRWRGQYHKGS